MLTYLDYFGQNLFQNTTSVSKFNCKIHFELTKLRRKNSIWLWTDLQDKAFEKLKKAVANAKLLKQAKKITSKYKTKKRVK
ncbi:hypothetical protein RFI_21682 [Reticulomyxa filosa]|uniref:Uncharacterized protein n=1 Tax=Reticulomyxa filosa TaxID=46433 RepID=X6MQG2_RETFI|nr:hypothetical protein RFI_21682 [Reticulomyxa filosa]|eukprot:ETO15682.1 hypothetical protein RFI_21682 [Reticulomyxa filosa]